METQILNNKGSKSNKLLVLIVVPLLLIIVFGLGIVVGIFVPRIFNVDFFEVNNNQTNTIDNTNNTDKTSSDQIIDDEGLAPCKATFTSNYLKLSFEYDQCNWEASEELTTPGSVYNKIIFEYKEGSQLVLEGNELGMGGGYSDCVNISEYKFLTEDISRVKLSATSNYIYWNAMNQFAFKGYNGSKHGDSDFNAFFEYLNPDSFPNTNACYVGAGVNRVELLNPSQSLTEVWQINKDLVITIESENPTDIFLDASDELVLNVFEAI